MGLGQDGPPATAKQVQYLLALLRKAGYDSFRDARRPLKLTQRQGNGKFSKKEASELIDRLLAAEGVQLNDDQPTLGYSGEQVALSVEEDAAARQLEAERLEVVRGLPAELLAGELTRRGWTVAPPGD